MEIEKFIKSLARKAKLGGRYSTANTYLYTLHSFQKFAGKASLTFEEITPESIKEYEQYLILNGTTRSRSTCACCVPSAIRHRSRT